MPRSRHYSALIATVGFQPSPGHILVPPSYAPRLADYGLRMSISAKTSLLLAANRIGIQEPGAAGNRSPNRKHPTPGCDRLAGGNTLNAPCKRF